MTIRILIADDHAVVAEGLRTLIDAQPDMKVVGLAADGRQAVRETLTTHPDVVVMDHAMPELNGTEAARIIREKSAHTRVVMLSMHSNSVHIQRALEAGAAGYVLKESVGAEVVDAIRTVHAGRRYLSKPVADNLPDGLTPESAFDSAALLESQRRLLGRLSPREREVLALVVAGDTSKEIAARLGISAPSVDTYRSRIMVKLNMGDLPALVRFAIRHGIASL